MLILCEEAERVPELVPIRHERMVESPFTFFRGAAAVMAEDLASSPVSGLRVQAYGDANLLNFGIYATPERRLVFDVNDFDETLPAPFEWDAKRLPASVVVVARARVCGAVLQACSACGSHGVPDPDRGARADGTPGGLVFTARRGRTGRADAQDAGP